MKMTIKESNVCSGIVLKSIPYKENDALLQVYTKEYGRLTIHARGIKKITSKNMAGCQSLTLSEFNIVVRKGISTLIKASPIDFFKHIKTDIELETLASFFCEFIYKECDENQPDIYIYDTLLNSLLALENGYVPQLIYVIYMAFILEVTGSSLQVDECCQCGNQHDIIAISHSGGGFVCKNCITRFDRQYDTTILKAFRHINKCTIKNIDKIKIEQVQLEQISSIMEQFIDDFTGLIFQTRKFLKQLQKLRGKM